MYSGVLVGQAARDSVVRRGEAGRSAKFEAGEETEEANLEVRGFPFRLRDESARMIAESAGKLLWLSDGAEKLIAESECIGIKDGKLFGRTRHSDRLLEALLGDVQPGSGHVDQLLARAANELPELFIQACSCSRRGSRRGAVALTLRRLNRKIADIPNLIRLYGLTPTEQQVARMIIQGRSVNEIAAELNKSVLTVRTHIKRMYVKMDVGTKEQLFSTVIRLMVD
jgi:DNA-binding CsgD family transcriptional regulator